MVNTVSLNQTTLLLGQPLEVAGLGGIDGGGVGTLVNIPDATDPQEPATLNQLNAKITQSGSTTENHFITYNASGEGQDSGVSVDQPILKNAQLINTSGSHQTNGSNFVFVDTVAAAGAITIEIRTVDIANQVPITIKDVSGAATTVNPITIIGEGGENIDDGLQYVIDCPFGAGVFTSTGSIANSLRNSFPQSVLIAESVGNQIPVAVYPAIGGLVDIAFGSSQGGASDPIQYSDITNEFTINQAGWYEITAVFIVQRGASPGIEKLEIAALVNGSLLRKHIPITLTNDDEEQPVQIIISGCFPSGAILKAQMATTQGSGSPDIGLYQQISPVTEWGSPTRAGASVEFKKLI